MLILQTLYKMARREGIELAQPFNAINTSWTNEQLESALNAIRQGVPVAQAAVDYKVPSGTLYGRCKKVGIALSKTNSSTWTRDDMSKAKESVLSGKMTINQVL